MANRHLSRSIALQSLFEWDFGGCDNSKIKEILIRDFDEFAPGLESKSFAEKLVVGVISNGKNIDKVIEKAAPEWPINQISIVDRNVLRLGLYELLFGDRQEVPVKVAINEAIELAKTFGGDSSGKFVNGVLGTVCKEMGDINTEPQKMIEEKLGGAVVYRMDGSDIFFALVHDVFGYWTLSKGHIEEGEGVKEGVIREVKEEIGVDIEIEGEIGSNGYVASDPEKGKIKKEVAYFLASTSGKDLKLKETGGLDGAQWFKMEDLADLRMYGDVRPLVAKAIKMLSGR